MKDPYTENYKTLREETEGDTNKWKDILYSFHAKLLQLCLTLCDLEPTRFLCP